MDSAITRHVPDVAAYHFGGFTLEPAEGVLILPGGTEVRLRPKSAEVLRHLVRNPGRLVSRDELMEAVWPSVVVSDDSITQCVAEIRRAFGDVGAPLLRTLPKRGYVLAAEVGRGDASPRVSVAPSEEADAAAPVARPWRRAPAATAVAVAIILAGAAGYWALRPAAAPTAPAPAAATPALPPRSYVVMPFTFQAGDPELDHLAAAVTEDLTSGLGRDRSSLVVGASTASTYRGQAADARRVGLDLGVGYVVEGSLRRLGPTLRVHVRLLDAATGKQLWADTLDQPFAEFAALSRTLTHSVEVALNYRLSDIESERATIDAPRDPTAQNLVLRARAHLFRASSRDGMEQARRMLEQALALDEGSANAHALLAHVVMTLVNGGWTEDVAGDLDTVEQHAARSLAIDPRYVRGHYVRGMVRQHQQRLDEALAEFDWVIDAAPSFAVAHQRRGLVKARLGRPAEGATDILQAIRISPRDTYIHFWYANLGIVSMMLGRDEDALGHLLRARAHAASHDAPDVLFFLAAAYAVTGRTDDARTTLDEFRRLRPDDTIAKRRLTYQRPSNHALYVATRERLNDALRPLGMPDGED